MHGLFRRRRLPHWDVLDGTYFVTACLDGSISSLGLSDLHRYRDELDGRPTPKGMLPEDLETTKHKLLFADESYDHWIRDDDELWRVIFYVEHNPVKAGLVIDADQWKFSSAFDRKEWGLRRDEPLKRPVA